MAIQIQAKNTQCDMAAKVNNYLNNDHCIFLIFVLIVFRLFIVVMRF